MSICNQSAGWTWSPWKIGEEHQRLNQSTRAREKKSHSSVLSLLCMMLKEHLVVKLVHWSALRALLLRTEQRTFDSTRGNKKRSNPSASHPLSKLLYSIVVYSKGSRLHVLTHLYQLPLPSGRALPSSAFRSHTSFLSLIEPGKAASLPCPCSTSIYYGLGQVSSVP